MDTDTRQRHIAAAVAPLQALLYTWAATVALAVAGYALTASSPSLGDVTWHQSARFGASLWMLALGSPLKLADATISLMPLTLTCLILALLVRFVTKARIEQWSQVAVAAASAFATTAMLGFLCLPETSRLTGIVTSTVATALIAAWAKARTELAEHRAVLVVQSAWQLLKPVVAAGAAVAILALAVAVVVGRARIGAIYGSYVVGASGATMLTLAQLLFLPNILVWIVSFLAGPGFSVGSGTRFSALEVQTEPLPAIPFFGALPGPGLSLVWIVAIVALAHAGYGLYRSRRYEAREAAVIGGVSVLIVLLGAVALVWLSSGSIGPGRMATAGPRIATAFALAAYAVILALGLLARHLLARLTGRGEGAGSGGRGSAGRLDDAEDSGPEPGDAESGGTEPGGTEPGAGEFGVSADDPGVSGDASEFGDRGATGRFATGKLSIGKLGKRNSGTGKLSPGRSDATGDGMDE